MKTITAYHGVPGKRLFMRVPDDGLMETGEGPTILDMVVNFEKAMQKWAKSGLKIVSRDTFEERLSVCRKCDLWDEKARFGMGKCNHKKCGCTRFKLWMATEKCASGKWVTTTT